MDRQQEARLPCADPRAALGAHCHSAYCARTYKGASMRKTYVLITCAALAASCNKGPEVKLKNATANEVTQSVRQSGVMDSNAMVQPGLWQSKVTVQEMNIP